MAGDISVRDGKALKNDAMAQVRAVQEILRAWDPINVAPGVEAPLDEYDGYAPHIVSMISNGSAVEDVAAHLEHISVDIMGLGESNERSRAHSVEVAKRIYSTLRPSNNSLQLP